MENPDSKRAAEGPPRVLLVDDDQDILTTLRALLQTSLGDVVVSVAPSGEEAIAMLTPGSIDLIITDYRLPGMDGLEVLRRAMELMPGVPRILVTGYPDVMVATQGLRERIIDNFVTKPIEPEYVLTVVRAALDAS